MENFWFQLPNFYVPRSISSFIEQHGTNMTAGDEVLKKLWSTEGGARLCLKSTISHVGKKVKSNQNFDTLYLTAMSSYILKHVFDQRAASQTNELSSNYQT